MRYVMIINLILFPGCLTLYGDHSQSRYQQSLLGQSLDSYWDSMDSTLASMRASEAEARLDRLEHEARMHQGKMDTFRWNSQIDEMARGRGLVPTLGGWRPSGSGYE